MGRLSTFVTLLSLGVGLAGCTWVDAQREAWFGGNDEGGDSEAESPEAQITAEATISIEIPSGEGVHEGDAVAFHGVEVATIVDVGVTADGVKVGAVAIDTELPELGKGACVRLSYNELRLEPGEPGTQAPESLRLCETPELPELPDLPEMPDMDMPEMPDMPELPQRAADPIPGLDEALDCPTDHACTMKRAFFSELTQDPAGLLKQTRVLPARGGGYKLFGVRPNSLPAELGLRNGDRIVSVNGTRLGGLQEAMELFAELQDESKFVVVIDRKGETIEKTYTLE